MNLKERNMNVNINAVSDSEVGLAGTNQESSSLTETLFGADTLSIRQRIEASRSTFLNSTDATDDMPIETIRDKFMALDIPSQGSNVDAYLDKLDQDVLPHCSHLASPRYMGHMTSPIPSFLPEIGRLVQTLNQNVVKMETSRSLTFLERQVIGMLHREIFRFDHAFYQSHLQSISEALGIFTSGGTLANIGALWTAWRRAQDRHPAQMQESVGTLNKPVIIGSELLHYSFDKGAHLLGAHLHKVPVNDRFQIDMDALREAIEQFKQAGQPIICIVAIAGTTDYGSVDDLRAICELAHDVEAHVHVDAAWGGGLILSECNRSLLDGIELADTVTIDGHKQLMLPLGCGLLFFRDPTFSQATVHHAPYAVRATSYDQGRFTLEGSRPVNALYLHAALHIIGKQGYDDLFTESLGRASYMAQAIDARAEFELIAPPSMNILAYRYIPQAYRGKPLDEQDNNHISQFNIALQKAQRQKGDSFVSRTFRPIRRYQNQSLALLRAVLLNPLTKHDDIDFLLNDQIQIARSLEAAG